MKTLARITFLAAALTAAALPIINAADATASAPGAAVKHPHLRAALAHHQAVRQHIAKKLGLSAEQISQLKAERAKTVVAVKAIRADANLTPEQKKAKVREAVKAARREMGGVLTPEQRAQLKTMRAHVRAHRAGKV